MTYMEKSVCELILCNDVWVNMIFVMKSSLDFVHNCHSVIFFPHNFSTIEKFNIFIIAKTFQYFTKIYLHQNNLNCYLVVSSSS